MDADGCHNAIERPMQVIFKICVYLVFIDITAPSLRPLSLLGFISLYLPCLGDVGHHRVDIVDASTCTPANEHPLISTLRNLSTTDSDLSYDGPVPLARLLRATAFSGIRLGRLMSNMRTSLDPQVRVSIATGLLSSDQNLHLRSIRTNLRHGVPKRDFCHDAVCEDASMLICTSFLMFC